ncbi:ATP-binding protein [Clostridiisalibacter paucivorans]|uniref:ATP-binding protein n=1 Tax=Clostridiisalibacter paucivorans TaxID=408753 RepID=UPI0005534916|nr:ATP-binding protein [Clostridiisalibacter paucivorans]
MCYIIKKTLSSDLLEMKSALQEILKSLQNVLVDETTLFDARLILDELICNGIIHGNKSDTRKKIDVFVEVNVDNNKYIKIEVSDEGSGFKYEREAYDPMKLTIGGRGLKIVDELSDEFLIFENRAISIKHL